VTNFEPNSENVLNAARNIQPERIHLYEHIIAPEVMEKILNKKFSPLAYVSPQAYLAMVNAVREYRCDF